MGYKALKKYIYFLYLLLLLFILTVFLYIRFDSVIEATTKEFQSIKVQEIANDVHTIEKLFQKILHLPSNIVTYLRENPQRQVEIDKLLSSFINKENRYVYIIYKDNSGYRYLADGSLNEDEKGIFGQKFFPLQEHQWDRAFASNTAKIFLQEKIDNLWITMLYPLKIFKDYQTFLVADLSTHAYLRIKEILMELKTFLQYLLLFFITIFVLIVALYMFLHREHRRNFIDPLTKIYNRAYLEKLHGKVALDKIVIAMIDIDYFKVINDTYGHAAGDEVLIEISKRIAKYIRNDDILIRYGGDELLLILQKEKDKDYKKLFERIYKRAKAEPITLSSGNTIQISLSIGVNLVAYKDSSLNEALKKADNALYHAKHSGRDCIRYFDEEEASKGYLPFQKITELIKDDKILLHYQPIYNIKTGKIDKYEALARLQDGERIYYPYQFLYSIFQTNVYREFTKKIVVKAFETIKKEHVNISVNFNKSDFFDDELFESIKELVLANRDLTKYIIFELLENEEMKTDDEKIINRIHYLRELGCKVALDDFGSGYSNISYFLTLEPDIIKIDGSIVKQLQNNERARRVLKSIAVFAKYMQIETIAEFVEDKKTLEILASYGIENVQGFFIGKPSATLAEGSVKIFDRIDSDAA